MMADIRNAELDEDCALPTTVEGLLAAMRATTGTCSNAVMRRFIEYELQTIDEQISHLKGRLCEMLLSDHLTNARRAKETRKDNFVLVRYLMIKELVNGIRQFEERDVDAGHIPDSSRR